jgi:hypothetical protein
MVGDDIVPDDVESSVILCSCVLLQYCFNSLTIEA